MADPLSITASLLAVTTAAVQAAKALRETITRLKDRDKPLARLQNELSDLIAILGSLEQVVGTEASMLALLKRPIERCAQVCCDFEKSMDIFGRKSKTGLRDWTKMEFMKGDIHEFIDMISGYKSTISVGLGTLTIHNAKISQKALKDYNEMIQDTSYALGIHLQRVDEKMAQYNVDSTTTPRSSLDLNDEKEVTNKCLRICEDASHYIATLASQESSLLQGPRNAEENDDRFEAQTLARQALNENQENFAMIMGQLRKRLETLTSKNDTSDGNERSRLLRDISTKECLKIRKVANEGSDGKYYRFGEAGQISDEVIQTLQNELDNDDPAKLTSMANLASTYRSRRRLGEAKELDLQAMDARKQEPELDQPDAPGSFSGSARQENPVNVVDSDSGSSTENDSVFSAPVSIPSTKSWEAGEGGMNSLLIQEFVNMLHEDEVLFSLLLVGISKELIGAEKMQRGFQRLLKHFANNLRADSLRKSHRDLRDFIRSYSLMITHELFSKTPMNHERLIKPYALEAERRIGLAEKYVDDERKVEHYLQSLRRASIDSGTSEAINVLNSDDEGSEQDSMVEENGEDEPYEGSLRNLHQMKHFIRRSTAYQILCHQLEGFVQPSLYSWSRGLLAIWSTPEHKNYEKVNRYKLRNFVTELQHLSPHDIRFEHHQSSSGSVRLIGWCQHIIELWTGEPWNWWPLPSYPRPLTRSETRLCWKCECGEERWAEMPNTFVKGLQSIIRSLPIDTLETQTVQPSEAHTTSDLTFRRNPKNNATNDRTFHQDCLGQQPSSSPSSSPSTRKANVIDMSVKLHRVLFLTKQNGDYKLAQICVSQLNCHAFFSTLKREYFRLRGMLRGRFSVWRYSHCDFYKFEKFDDHKFTPRIKDSFPDLANTDYEYQPRPMDNIPPISEHEFTKRFYACHKPRPLLHLHHKCKSLGSHSSDILKLFPKKMTELEEAGDMREQFWGIYAREIVSLSWILFYNFVCLSPSLVFFFAKAIPQGLGTDLQDPAVPFFMTFSMFSLFWSLFVSSLHFGKPH